MRREKQKSTLFIDSLYRHLFGVPLAAHTIGLIAAWRPQTLYSQMLCELSMDQAVRIAKRFVLPSGLYNQAVLITVFAMEFLRRLQVVASLLEEIGGSMEDFHWKYHRSSSRCFIGGYGSSLYSFNAISRTERFIASHRQWHSRIRPGGMPIRIWQRARSWPFSVRSVKQEFKFNYSPNKLVN